MGKDKEQIYLYSNDNIDFITFYTEPQTLKGDFDKLEKFIKAVEKLVRADVRYDRYIASLHQGDILHCAILGNIDKKAQDKITIEMHHGPIFTLFSIVEIVVRHNIRNDIKMTTFSVADEVLRCHEQNMVQVVGLAKTPHKSWHMRKIFVHMKAAFGRIDKFVEQYNDGLADYHRQEILQFLKLCKEQEVSNDNGFFDVGKRLKLKN